MKGFLTKYVFLSLLACVPLLKVHAVGEFKMTINTDPNSSNDTSITIPVNPNYAPLYAVDWGDGGTDSSLIGDASHTYATPGIYQISISGNPAGLYINNTDGIREKIVSIDEWGTIQWLSMQRAFAGIPNLTINASDSPDLSLVTDMSYMFANIPTFSDVGGNMGNWGTSNVQDMESLFNNGGFNAPISGWNVSNVTNMRAMFSGATSFNQDISGWNTSAVTSMQEMFNGATAFNQPIGSWDTGTTTNMSNMFASASSFNQPLSFNTINVTDMSHMFEAATAFNSNISFDTSNVTDMSYMFHEATAFDQPVYFYTGKVTDMSYMFADMTYNQNSIVGWDTATTTNMSNMFARNTAFNQNISGWNVSGVTNMSSMFDGAISFNQPIGVWDTSSLTNAAHMFNGASAFNQNLGSWNVSHVTDFTNMFAGATSFSSDISNWNTSSATQMSNMFLAATNFNTSILNWDVSHVENFSQMFSSASSFNQDLSLWDTSSATNMSDMFNGASGFNQNISSWNYENVTDLTNFLLGANMNFVNYDALLRAWRNQNTQNGLSVAVGQGVYCNAASERSYLILTKGWGIVDVGTPAGCPAPTVVSVTSSNPNGNYKTGDVVNVQVVFSENVNVGSGDSPTITLETGTTDAVATLVSGSGTNTLTFSFTVLSSHGSADLQYVSASSLIGNIKDTASSSLSADLNLPALNSVNSLAGGKNITINQSSPVVSTSTPVQATTGSWFGATSFGGTIESVKPAGTCDAVIFTKSLRIGQRDPQVLEVKKFLNKNLGIKLKLNSVFDAATRKAVTRFQEKYRKDILDPTRLKRGTGMWYPATIKKANELLCKGE